MSSVTYVAMVICFLRRPVVDGSVSCDAPCCHLILSLHASVALACVSALPDPFSFYIKRLDLVTTRETEFLLTIEQYRG